MALKTVTIEWPELEKKEEVIDVAVVVSISKVCEPNEPFRKVYRAPLEIAEISRQAGNGEDGSSSAKA